MVAVNTTEIMRSKNSSCILSLLSLGHHIFILVSRGREGMDERLKIEEERFEIVRKRRRKNQIDIEN